jgi:2-octaprenyl-6-methoxyphenol hydroxylase
VTVTGATLDEGAARLTLADGSGINARLAIGAEGRASRLRDAMGVRVLGWKYGQTAIVCTLAHERPHDGVAHEYFLPSGPFALLPLTGNRTNIVWSEKTRAVQALLAMDDVAFHAELRRRVGDVLGEFRVDGPRFSYPLELALAASYVAPHAALIGDSAHGVHPIAGQGLNMGLRDVAALAECIADGARVGLDLGDHATLERYQTWRRFDNVALALGMDAMCRLFSNDIGPLRIARDIGMAAVGKIGVARRMFMREAAGGLGDLPKLLRGESLAEAGV